MALRTMIPNPVGVAPWNTPCDGPPSSMVQPAAFNARSMSSANPTASPSPSTVMNRTANARHLERAQRRGSCCCFYLYVAALASTLWAPRAAPSFALPLSPKASPHLGGQQVFASSRAIRKTANRYFMSLTRALQRMKPWPLHVSVTVPGPVAFTDFPMAKIPLKPGATIRQAGFAPGVSETAFRQVMFLASVISVENGCEPSLSVVAWSDVTFPGRTLCAPACVLRIKDASANRTSADATSTDASADRSACKC